MGPGKASVTNTKSVSKSAGNSPVQDSEKIESMTKPAAISTTDISALHSQLSAIMDIMTNISSRVDVLEFQKSLSRGEPSSTPPAETESNYTTPPTLRNAANPSTLLSLKDWAEREGMVLNNKRKESSTFGLPRQSMAFTRVVDQKTSESAAAAVPKASSSVVIATIQQFVPSDGVWDTFNVIRYTEQTLDIQRHMSKKNPSEVYPFADGLYTEVTQEYIVRQLEILAARDLIPPEYLPLPSKKALELLPWDDLSPYLEMALKPLLVKPFESTFKECLRQLKLKLSAKKCVDPMVRFGDSSVFHTALVAFLTHIPMVFKNLCMANGSNVPPLKADRDKGIQGIMPIILAALPEGLFMAMLDDKVEASDCYLKKIYASKSSLEAIQSFTQDLITSQQWHFANEQQHRRTKERRNLIVASLKSEEEASPGSRSSRSVSALEGPAIKFVDSAGGDSESFFDYDHTFDSFNAFNESNPQLDVDKRLSESAKFTRSVNWKDAGTSPPPKKKDLGRQLADSTSGKQLFKPENPFPNSSAPHPCVWQVLNEQGCVFAGCKQNHTQDAAKECSKAIIYKACRFASAHDLPVPDTRSYEPGMTIKDMKMVHLAKKNLSMLVDDHIPPVTYLEPVDDTDE